MDISGIFGKKDDAANVDGAANVADGAANSQNVTLGDPLTEMNGGNFAENQAEFAPNETVSTNDNSAVGEFKPVERPQPVQPASEMIGFAVPSAAAKAAEEAKSANIEDSAKNVSADLDNDFANGDTGEISSDTENSPNIVTPEIIAPPEPEDPAKLDFIKTYTQEFDDMLRRATDTAQKILDSIDAAVRDHSPDIAIPDEAKEFLEKAPEDGKVQKFDDARAIVRAVMEKASDAKNQSQAAAAEAAQVYDDVQNFKRDTKEQIKNLRGEEDSEDSKIPGNN